MAQDDATPPRPLAPATAPPPENVKPPQAYATFEGGGGGGSSSPEQLQQQQLQAQRPTFTDAVKSIKKEEFLGVAQIPCAKPGFTTGIISGFVTGMLRYVIGAPIGRAANWAVGAFVAGSIGRFEWCQYQRATEKQQIARAIQIMETTKREKREKAEAEARRRREEEEAARQASRSWWRFWNR